MAINYKMKQIAAKIYANQTAKSMLINSIRCTFTTKAKHPKGSIGKEGSLGSNFSFPRHKELFNTGYYDGENNEIDDTDMFESPISKQMRSQNKFYEKDAIDTGVNNR